MCRWQNRKSIQKLHLKMIFQSSIWKLLASFCILKTLPKTKLQGKSKLPLSNLQEINKTPNHVLWLGQAMPLILLFNYNQSLKMKLPQNLHEREA